MTPRESREGGRRERGSDRGAGERGRGNATSRRGRSEPEQDPGVITGPRAVTEAIRAGSVREVLVASPAAPGGAANTQGMSELLEAAEEAGVPVRSVPRDELDRRAEDHRGVIARLRRAPELSERGLAEFPFTDDALVVILDGVTDPQNLGAAARSAEAAGAAVLVSRVHRAAPVTPAAIRASSGALLHLSHARVANITRAVERLQQVGFTVAGLDEAAGADIYSNARPSGRLAVVVGSEGTGLSRLVRERCDVLVALPMHGRVGSLNASAALAAVLYGWALVPPAQAPE
jgi:23S rRNA (guanosine2251-2'-O)-methyltransferase